MPSRSVASRCSYRIQKTGAPAPVYDPSFKGNALLAEMTGDYRFLAIPIQQPTMHDVWHWLAVSETHITFDEKAR